MLYHRAGVCGATGWQQLPLTGAGQHSPSCAHCLRESLLLGFFTLLREAQKSSRSGDTPGVQLGSELLDQCWQGCSEGTGTCGQQSRNTGNQPHITPCCLCSSCQGMQGMLWGLWLAQLSLHHTPFSFGDTWAHPLWLQ